MRRFLEWVESVAAAIGGPGLFLIAFLDSSFLSFPQVNDLLVIGMVIANPERLIYLASMATLGSLAGCVTLYLVARRGGEAVLRRRASGGQLDRAMRLIQRYGLLAVLVPALLPPPAPFKAFVLMAGVAQVPLGRFTTAVAIGRGVRYFGEGLLAAWYGEQAVAFLERNGRVVSLVLAAAVLVGGVAFALWRRRARRSAGGSPEI